MDSARQPITTAAELDALPPEEIEEGYRDGIAGEPEPGDNRPLAYWHGWRNGDADRRNTSDAAQRALAASVRSARQSIFQRRHAGARKPRLEAASAIPTVAPTVPGGAQSRSGGEQRKAERGRLEHDSPVAPPALPAFAQSRPRVPRRLARPPASFAPLARRA